MVLSNEYQHNICGGGYMCVICVILVASDTGAMQVMHSIEAQVSLSRACALSAGLDGLSWY